MKRINISGQVGQTIAQIALFQLLQSQFNLYPGRLLKKIDALALTQGKTAGDIICSLHGDAQKVLNASLVDVQHILLNEPAMFRVEQVANARQIQEYFGIVPKSLAKEITTKARAEGLDPVATVKFLQREMPTMVQWAFSQACRIVNEREE